MTHPARVALRVVWVALIPIMIGCARLAPELIAPTQHLKSSENHARISGTSNQLAPAPPSTAPPRVSETPREREDDMDVDLYGNDVTDAVAKYKLDSPKFSVVLLAREGLSARRQSRWPQMPATVGVWRSIPTIF